MNGKILFIRPRRDAQLPSFRATLEINYIPQQNEERINHVTGRIANSLVFFSFLFSFSDSFRGEKN